MKGFSAGSFTRINFLFFSIIIIIVVIIIVVVVVVVVVIIIMHHHHHHHNGRLCRHLLCHFHSNLHRRCLPEHIQVPCLCFKDITRTADNMISLSSTSAVYDILYPMQLITAHTRCILSVATAANF